MNGTKKGSYGELAKWLTHRPSAPPPFLIHRSYIFFKDIMTDKFHSLTVVLEEDIREDDALAIINAIKMTKGVLTVTPHVADVNSTMAHARIKADYHRKIIEIFD